MRKTLATLACAATIGAAAQNSAVVSAYNYLQDGDLAKAAEFIEPAITNEGTMVKAKTWFYRGQIYQRVTMGDDAALKGQFPDALDKAVSSFQKCKELDAKAEFKDESLQALVALQGTALNEGIMAHEAKDYDKAVARYALSEAVAKHLGIVDSSGVYNSALAYEAKGDMAKAAERYQACIDIGYDKPEIFRYLASLKDRNNDLNGAITTVQAGRKRHPADKELMLDEVAFLQKAGRTGEVEASTRAALQQDPGNCILHSVLAGIHEARGEYDQAETGYRKSVECDPKFFDGYYNIGVLCNNRAATEYDKCAALKDDAAYAKCKKAADEVLLKAIPPFEMAHSLRPDDKPTMQQLKTLYAKAGNTARFEEMKKLLGE